MRIVLSFMVSLIASAVIAQTTDYPDFRSKKDVFARIMEKDIRNDIASFSMGGIDESVGKLPLKTLPITGFGTDYINFAGENIEVKITATTFDRSKKKLRFYEETYVVKIDKKSYFGYYARVPSTYNSNISVVISR